MRDQYKLLQEKYQLIVENDENLNVWLEEWDRWYADPKIDRDLFKIFLTELIKQSGKTVQDFISFYHDEAFEDCIRIEQEESGHDISETDWEPDDESVHQRMWDNFEITYNQEHLRKIEKQRQTALNKDNPGIEMDI